MEPRRPPPPPGRRRAARAAPLLLAVLAGAACRAGPAESPSSPLEDRPSAARAPVLLVTVDTMRADRLGPAGPMPGLTALAGDGIRFTNARAPVPLTLPAHATMLSGLGPHRHGVRDNLGHVMPPVVPLVTGRFAEAGYRTAAFLGGYPLDRRFGLDRGFELYDDRMTTGADSGNGATERPADEVVAAALAWLRTVEGDAWFVWVHVFDAHDPYRPPPGFGDPSAHPYDRELAWIDHALVPLFERARNDGAWILVAGDHGEALGEHGEPTHGVFVYDATLRVPLCLVPPGDQPGREVSRPVSLADVGPTLLAATGLPPLPDIDGRSLVGSPAGRPGPLAIESIYGRRKYGWAPLTGVVDWPWKYVEAPRPELYDLSRDPNESQNLYGHHRTGRLEDALRRIEAARPEPRVVSMPAGELERLASLGYVGGSSVAAGPEMLEDRRQRPDPKDRIAALVPLDRGLEALEAARWEEADRLLARALEADPDNVVAWNNRGIVAMQTGRTERAAEAFREALRRDRFADKAANNLGIALARLDRVEEAIRAYRAALKIRPDFVGARFNLAIALHRAGRSSEAIRELDRVSRLAPDFAGLARARREMAPAGPGPTGPPGRP